MAINPIRLIQELNAAINIDDNARVLDRFGQPFRSANNSPDDITNLVMSNSLGSNGLEKRTSNTFVDSIDDFNFKFGRQVSNTPESIYVTSPVINGLRGNSATNIVIPQNRRLAEYINAYNPNQVANPLVLSDRKNSYSFLPIDKVSQSSIRPVNKLTNQEQIGKTLDTVDRILKSPAIPDKAKESLVKNIGSTIYGGFKTNADNSLGLDYRALTNFMGDLTSDQQFKKLIGEENVGNLYDLQRQYSTLGLLDRTLNNTYARTYQGAGDDALLGFTLANTDDGLARSMYPVKINKDAPEKIVFAKGFDATPDTKAIDTQASIRNYKNSRYLEQPVGENLYLDATKVSNQGKLPPNIKQIVGQGNVIFENRPVSKREALLLKEQYRTGFEQAVNSALYQGMGKTNRTLSDDGREIISESVPQLTDNSPVGSIGYVVTATQDTGKGLRNNKKLALKTANGIQTGRIALDGNQVKFSTGGVSGNRMSLPIGTIERKVNDLGEEVIELPSVLNQIVAGRVNYKPEELQALGITPAIKEGEDKLKALARFATLDIPDSDTVQFPVGLKRFSEDGDNFLLSSLPDDDQSKLLARAMNFADPNVGAIQRMGIQLTPDSSISKAMRVKPVEGINSTVVMPISNEMQKASGKSWEDLYAEQLVDDTGKPLSSLVIPYNPVQGNNLLLNSVQDAWKKITGSDAQIQFINDDEGVPLAYLGNTPTQARSFPTAEDWTERGRQPIMQPKAIRRSLTGWVGGNDQYMNSGDVTTAINNQVTPETLAAMVNRNDKEMGGYARTDSVRAVLKAPEEYYGSGKAAHSSRSGDLYNVGEPISNVDARYSVALKTLTDPRFDNYIQDKPSFINDPDFRAMYDNEPEVLLNSDEIDELERWLDSNNLGFSAGQGTSIAPLSIVEQEARDFTPAFTYTQKVGIPNDDFGGKFMDADGNVSDTTTAPMGRRIVQLGMADEDIASVRTYGRGKDAVANAAMDSIEGRAVRNKIPYPVSRDVDGNIVRIAAPFNRPTQGSMAVRTNQAQLVNDRDLYSRQPVIDQPLTAQELANEQLIQSGMVAPAIQKYRELEAVALAKGDAQSAQWYKTEADILEYAASRKPMLKDANDPLEGLNLGEANQGYVESFMYPEEVGNMSDNLRYEANTSAWEPSVSPVYDDTVDEFEPIRSERYGVEVNPQYIVREENEVPYIYVPKKIQRQLQDDYDREAIRQRKAYENNPLRFINTNSFSAIQPNILNDAGQNYGRTDEIVLPTTPVWNNQVQSIIANTPANQKAAFEAQRQANIAANRQTSVRNTELVQPVVVTQPAIQSSTQPSVAVRTLTNPVPNNSGGISQGNTQLATQPSTQPVALRNTLTPEQQQYLMLGLGGLGAYGLYDAINQQDRRVA